MACSDLLSCAAALVQAIDDSNSPSWLDGLNAALAVLIAATSVLIAWRVFTFDKARTLRGDREQLRENLRLWFQSLSKTAPRKVREASGRLRSECEEIADAEGAKEILILMLWAQEMLGESYRQAEGHRLSAQIAHERRVVIKRRFRQFIAVWSRRPKRGRRLILDYTSRGWPAIASEPLASTRSAQFLAPRRSWVTLSSVWPAAASVDE